MPIPKCRLLAVLADPANWSALLAQLQPYFAVSLVTDAHALMPQLTAPATAPDLLLLDRDHTAFADLSCIRILREAPHLRTLAIGLLSQDASVASKVAGMRAGADLYLVAPGYWGVERYCYLTARHGHAPPHLEPLSR